ncbi:hypothetical protein V6Z11_A10G113200 [Gossypium hirsutum]
MMINDSSGVVIKDLEVCFGGREGTAGNLMKAPSDGGLFSLGLISGRGIFPISFKILI